ncbi:hypothetical protein ACILPN_11135 [Yersinia wautersii]|uniref:hypothetical protein n=1 Tax=Yersinia pseudotuberculosis TaxID=633 RepID=UPI0015F12654|nr:hypothetical protein [Yersinia pseudotuberculosis]
MDKTEVDFEVSQYLDERYQDGLPPSSYDRNLIHQCIITLNDRGHKCSMFGTYKTNNVIERYIYAFIPYTSNVPDGHTKQF